MNMPAPFPNMTNVTSFETLAAFDNTITNGYWSPIVVLSIFLVVLFVTSNNLKSRSFVVASFFAALAGAFLWILGLFAWYYETICIAALVGSVVLLSRE
jgi:hypothetical protein